MAGIFTLVTFIFTLLLCSPTQAGIASRSAITLEKYGTRMINFCKRALGDGGIFDHAQYSPLTPNEIVVPWKSLNDDLIKKLNDRKFRPQYVPRTTLFNERAGYRDAAVIVKGAPVTPTIRIKLPSGHIFKRLVDHQRFKDMGVAWLDESSGLVWSPVHVFKTDYATAKNICNQLTRRELPSANEYLELWDHLVMNDEIIDLFPEPANNNDGSCWTAPNRLEIGLYSYSYSLKIGRPKYFWPSDVEKHYFRCVMAE